MKKSRNIRFIVVLLAVILIVNLFAAQVFERFDLTQNKRYTLSSPSKEIVKDIEKPILVSVFLKGDFPSNFRRLENETRYMLEEFSAQNRKIKFEFFNPLEENKAEPEQIGHQFLQAGMPPQRLNIKKSGKTSESLIFPWAIATYGEKQVQIPLLKMNPEDSEEDLVNNSVQNLEYAFANAFKQLTTEKSKKIAVLRGHGELKDIEIADFLKGVGTYYHTAPFTLDSVAQNPQKTLKQLKEYDLIVEAKPTQPFGEEEKFVLDQYLMNGGKALWLLESVAAEKDSLFTSPHQTMLAFPRDLKLTDFFFKYGVRITPSLINDLHADEIVLATGTGRQTQFQTFPWYYAPLVVSKSEHPIAHNIAPVRFDFANPMDTLKNDLNKTILLKSSIATKVEGTPREINLRSTIGQKPDFETYMSGPQNLAVLVEGEFTSVYKDRVKPFELKNPKEKSPETKMIVISDGDVIKNEIEKGKPVSLEYDPKTGKSYGNKEFLLNAVNYLLDDSGLLNIRSKKVQLAFLDYNKIEAQRSWWQVINIGVPLIILALFGMGFRFYRKRKYQ
ncbi:MAG TPA: gliding motility-associated ABC transporter substrate-binding protein GldG [Flavobacteriaceae bacterium]|nr:gliding motility-associated ABC transporter substrate-binding protein GldG [Flavobacteriaceae bacterium]